MFRYHAVKKWYYRPHERSSMTLARNRPLKPGFTNMIYTHVWSVQYVLKDLKRNKVCKMAVRV